MIKKKDGEDYLSDAFEEIPNILDESHDYYVIREKFWDFGSGDVYDEHENNVGKMKRKILSLRGYTEILDNDDNMVFSINEKLLSWRATYDIKDEDGELIGRTKRKLLAPFRPKIWMEDKNGDHILESQGSFLGWDFTITDVDGNEIAQVGKLDKWKDLFFEDTIIDYSDRFALEVKDKTYDRRKLLGFVLSIDRSVHD